MAAYACEEFNLNANYVIDCCILLRNLSRSGNSMTCRKSELSSSRAFLVVLEAASRSLYENDTLRGILSVIFAYSHS